MNRILAAIDRTRDQIRQRLEAGLTNAEDLEKMSAGLNMEVGEFVKFQEIKSSAMMLGTISADEAQTIYGFLGESPSKFNGQPTEVKVVLTQIFAELLKKKIQS
jgi:hypothetical protein